MASAVERTLDLLARSSNEQAAAVLRHALGRTDDLFGVEAALAIGRHGSLGLKYEVLRRVDELSTRQKEALHSKARAFSDTVLHGLASPDADDRRLAVRWIAAVDDFERFSPLLNLLTNDVENGGVESFEIPDIAHAANDLVERMFDHVAGREEANPDGYQLRNVVELHSAMFDALLGACRSLEHCPVPDQVLEWTLILTDAEFRSCQTLLTKLPKATTDRLVHMLQESGHPGVLRLALNLLRRSYPPDYVFEVWGERDDPEFVHHVLRTWPDNPTTLQRQNLAKIEYVPWLSATGEELNGRLRSIPEPLLPAVARAVAMLGLDEDSKRTVLSWLLRNGDAATRTAAGEQFDLLDRSETHEIIRDGLDDDDENVQIWATKQVRSQSVPQAFRLLVERLDSDNPEIAAVAREELSEFNLDHMLKLLDSDPSRVTPSMGRLICKVDPGTTEDLRRELAHPIRGRRLRALKATLALGLNGDVVDAVAALLEDSDMLVRRTAAETLGMTPSRASLVALETATRDESARVREAAIGALQVLRRNIARAALLAQKSAEAAAE